MMKCEKSKKNVLFKCYVLVKTYLIYTYTMLYKHKNINYYEHIL